jgi:guanylate kinase
MQRLHARSDLPEDEIRRRLEGACGEMHAALSRDYYRFVLNDHVDSAVENIQAIIHHMPYSEAKEKEAREAVERLYRETQNYLKTS